MFKLAKEHSLTKAGLRRVHIVETAELGLRPGDIVFEFPFGRIVDTGMACRHDGIIPPDVDIMTIHKEAAAIRAAGNRKAQEEEPEQRERLGAGGVLSQPRKCFPQRLQPPEIVG